MQSAPFASPYNAHSSTPFLCQIPNEILVKFVSQSDCEQTVLCFFHCSTDLLPPPLHSASFPARYFAYNSFPYFSIAARCFSFPALCLLWHPPGFAKHAHAQQARQQQRATGAIQQYNYMIYEAVGRIRGSWQNGKHTVVNKKIIHASELNELNS